MQRHAHLILNFRISLKFKSFEVLWCNWSALRTLNSVIRVQVSVEPFIVSLYSIRLRDGRLSALMKMKLLPGVLLSINYFAFRTRFNESDGVSLNQ